MENSQTPFVEERVVSTVELTDEELARVGGGLADDFVLS
jgi:hypothetical protein